MSNAKMHVALAATAVVVLTNIVLASNVPIATSFPDDSGVVQTYSTSGALTTQNPFFQSLGTNGRACVHCHEPGDAFSITPAHLMQRFQASHGMDPVFRAVDGTNTPDADMSTEVSRLAACSMLLNRGLIRIGLPIPAGAEFQLVDVDDPYGHASETDLSLFRRPLPTTNLRFISGVMWDGREGKPDGSHTLAKLLTTQAMDATRLHAQGSAVPTAEQLARIVKFETSVYTAQASDKSVGRLDQQGAHGGPFTVAFRPFYIGINDALGADPSGQAFNSRAMNMFQSWQNLPGAAHNPVAAARGSVARGEVLFNTKPISITDVGGLNDDLGVPVIAGTCTTCHDTPNVGNHSLAVPLNIGLTDESRRTPDMPLYTLQNIRSSEIKKTTDPGRAMLTGKWKDVGRFKGPVLHALAARAPYFHNGFAADLPAVIDFYNTRFNVNFTEQEKADLVAFLRSL